MSIDKMQDPTSEVLTETNPENVPLPTNSMITVSLSDIQDSAKSPEMVEAESPASTVSSPKCSSVCSSQISSDSDGPAAVNWEGLEKTEEQEPKDDATDEVSGRCRCRNFYSCF